MMGPPHPVLIYDGKCAFCRIWVEYWKQIAGSGTVFAPSQDVASQYPKIPAEDFQRSVQLVLPDGERLSGAEAVFRLLAPSSPWLQWAYRRIPGFAAAAEAAYRLIASHRNFFYRATVLLFGRKVEPLRDSQVRTWFVSLLGLIWCIAFLSFGAQALGLIGSRGVLPVRLYLDRVAAILPGSAWAAAPTVFWLNSSDTLILAVCAAGATCGALAFLGLFWRGALFAAFVLYLSLVNVAQEFLSYQWDILLLEAGFLAIFLGYSRIFVWLFRWLLFRLMFLSGAVKLLSGDETWRNLTALLFHYQTQPLPTPLAWYVHQLPSWFQRFSCLGVLSIELLAPFLVLGPRRLRLFAAPLLIGLQVLIMLTGNYAFFNWLTIALCIFLFDDSWIARFLPARAAPLSPWAGARSRRALSWAVAVFVLVLSFSLMMQTLTGRLPPLTTGLVSLASPFSVAGSYGLFANMTTQRPEIILEGSADGVVWQPYEFKYKPGRLDRAPRWIAPHQPRLDWQMWFAALGDYRENVWLLNTMARLLGGSPQVLALLEHNPFPRNPPKFIRAVLYDYEFTRRTERAAASGDWWTRRPLGTYLRPVSLSDLSGLPLLRGAP